LSTATVIWRRVWPHCCTSAHRHMCPPYCAGCLGVFAPLLCWLSQFVCPPAVGCLGVLWCVKISHSMMALCFTIWSVALCCLFSLFSSCACDPIIPSSISSSTRRNSALCVLVGRQVLVEVSRGVAAPWCVCTWVRGWCRRTVAVVAAGWLVSLCGWCGRLPPCHLVPSLLVGIRMLSLAKILCCLCFGLNAVSH
jgi:hypothetical protein